MLKFINNFLRKRERAGIAQQLDHIYAEMRAATDRGTALKKLAERQEAEELLKLRIQEQMLIAKAKKMDNEEVHLAISQRAARAW